MARSLLAVLLGIALALRGVLPARGQDTGWTIERFHAEIVIQPDASLLISEAIDVDFGELEKHGIYREIPVRYRYTKDHDRVYDFKVETVTDANGKAWQYSRSRHGANEQIRVGDPDRTISGRQTYRITYRVQGALNAFPDHDELYWNVNGLEWTVPLQRVTATILLAGGGLTGATCYEGYAGASHPCAWTAAPERIEFGATAPFEPGQNLTIVAAIRKGAIAEPRVILREKPRGPAEFFETVNPLTVGGTLLTLVGGLALLSGGWWRTGRDRRYTSIYYLTENLEEETRPLFKGDEVVVEFQPPEGLRPAQMGLLLDERADTKDVTATIVDLAVRGYLMIAEAPRKGLATKLFAKKDWTLTRRNGGQSEVKEYERIIYHGLFASGVDEVTLSSLRNKFHEDLSKAQKALYRDATAKKWFSRNPDRVRTLWALIELAAITVGVALGWLLGSRFGAAFVAIPIALCGLLLLATHRAMPRRTAHGSELLRRVLGFRRYITAAETDRQRFNEQANIFAEYLPYAIVFGAVERWARAFRDIDTTAATTAWYAGSGDFSSTSFSRNLAGFSSSVSGTIASTPGGSGASGFSGGGSGGGGGGGGGGSW